MISVERLFDGKVWRLNLGVFFALAEMLDEMNTKLSHAVQLYDQKLQERYASQQYGANGYQYPSQYGKYFHFTY